MLIYKGDSESEVLVVQVEMKNISIRIIAGYGAQECAPVVVREKYRNDMEEQIVRAYLAGCEVLVAEDANAKLGPDALPGDPHPMSENGRLLDGMIRRNGLLVVNTSDKCEGGPITRKRLVDGKLEQSCLDFILTSAKIGSHLTWALIDKDQIFGLTKYCTTKGNPSVKRSDHFTLLAQFDICENPVIHKREEIFKLRDENGLALFKQMTQQNEKLRRCFDGGNIEVGCEKWYKEVEKIMHQCFRKIRITDSPPKSTLDYEIHCALADLKMLKEQLVQSNSMLKPVLQLEITKQELKIAILQGGKCKHIINEDMKSLLVDGAFSFNDAWKLKKKMFPRSHDSPFAVYDKEDNLVTDYMSILDVMKEEFVFRLRNREIKDEYTDLKELKDYLCRLRLNIARNKDFKLWNIDQLMKAISKLKTNKCKDPHGHINELYKNMGKDGLYSLLDMLNEIKKN